ncbi:phosphotransferase enzyme family protein [Pseudogracilibacillus auburnensis]|uniref:Ser/Thr protein kinase RdoA (MazF antagonist) n=1 Tax=Pseudogracilibacillus auburnensis TaxID=1494959 RepID=A0A2V3W749_9BACI|nr:phosphotransferase [Pseudogracilibacillus auburnensis]MBO1001662.1 phosphotransferase [Pseudogracilibacillus auburnensis]PXW89416.1 Ser/Thr protein kinase RdoA (MazF antagonist) [Pseudogracilibacillus auburnensis]
MSNLQAESWKDALKVFNEVAAHGINTYPALTQEVEIKLINYSENATYLVTDPKTEMKHILRVSRPNYHTKVEIESELKWLKSIHDSSPLSVPMPIKGRNNEYIHSVRLKNDPQEYYCTLFTYLEGKEPDESKESELINQFENLGEVTAQLHEHSILNHNTFKRKNRLTWDYENILGDRPKWARWQDGKGITPERKELFEVVSKTIKSRLETFGKTRDRFGLIHADLRLANLLVDKDQISVIDFDDCGFGWYLFDLGTSLSFIEDKLYVPDLVESWMKGYRKVRALTPEEVEEIPTFIMMRRLQLISWVGSRDNETAEALGEKYSEDTDRLAIEYLQTMR